MMIITVLLTLAFYVQQGKGDTYDTPYTSPPTTTCSPLMCARFCEYGFKKNSQGCDICECNCPPLCKKYCELGFKKNADGCDICECNCPAIKCEKVCPNDSVLDQNNCPTCKCQCPQVKCLNCPYGYQVDEFGCQTCKCKDCEGCTMSYG